MSKHLFACLLIILSGCRGQSPPGTGNIEIIDDLGRTIALESSPERIVTLAPNMTEIVFAAGLGERVVAVTTSDNYPPQVKDLRSVSALPLDLEAVISISPSLAVGTDHVNDARDAERLQTLGIPTLFYRFSSVADVFRVMRALCTLRPGDCRQADALEARWRTLQEVPPLEEDRPTVLLLAGDDVLYAFGGQSYIEEMIRAAGGKSLTTFRSGQATVLSEEFVLAARPDVIVLTMGTDYKTERLLELHPAWDVVPAVQRGHVFSVHPDYFVRPGPRLVDGTEQLQKILQRAAGARQSF